MRVTKDEATCICTYLILAVVVLLTTNGVSNKQIVSSTTTNANVIRAVASTD